MALEQIHLRVKFGGFEVECTGSEEFLRGGFKDSVEEVIMLVNATGTEELGDVRQQTQVVEYATERKSRQETSLSDIATRLGSKNAPELAMASAAYMTLVEKKEKFERKEILQVMRRLPSLYKLHMASNLKPALDRLVKKGHLNRVSKDTYALKATEIVRLERILYENR